MTPNELMLTSILKYRRIDLYTRQILLTPEQQTQYENMQQRYDAGEPLQYVIGHTAFINAEIDVTPDVLIPRPETEILVESVIQWARQQAKTNLRILDLGTGSGNIAVALAQEISGSQIDAVDVFSSAVKQAQHNVVKNAVSGNVNVMCADMIEFLSQAKQAGTKYDAIVSNPPYIPTRDLESLPRDVRQEPCLALDGGSDGLSFYRQISEKIEGCLHEQGAVFFEVGDGQAQRVGQILLDAGLDYQIGYIKDYRGTDRVVCGQPQMSVVTV